MKKAIWGLVAIVTAVMLSFTFTSCNQEDDDVNIGGDDEKNTRYYVKYEVYMGILGGNWGQHSMNISYTTENGRQNITTTSSEWNGTFGPIKKGTKLEISANASLVRNDTYNYVRLSVSRDKEPFVIKGEKRGLGEPSLSVSYNLQ